MKIGIIAQPQAYQEHERVFSKCNVETLKIENVKQLDEIDGLMLCGEDAAELEIIISKLNLYEKVLEKVKMDFPIMGIASGVEMLVKNAEPQAIFPQIMDMEIEKEDGYLEVTLKIPALGPQPFKGIFKKKIYISKIAPNIGILSQIDLNRIVFVRQGNFLAATFHPELAEDCRVHKYFIKVIRDNSQQNQFLTQIFA